MGELWFVFGSVYGRVPSGIDDKVRVETIECRLD
jgi:hypothetical protein